MCQSICQDFSYTLRLEGVPRSAAETLALRSGSCRDYAVLMIDAARSLGLAARVSGYVYSASPSGPTGGGHHAWVRVYVPGRGWIDFDPTNGLVGGRDLNRVSRHLVLTTARLTGSYTPSKKRGRTRMYGPSGLLG